MMKCVFVCLSQKMITSERRKARHPFWPGDDDDDVDDEDDDNEDDDATCTD